MRAFALTALVFTGLAQAQQAPVPDPRLEPQLGRIVMAEIQRSVLFERTMPPRETFAGQPRPQVNERDMVRAGDHIYVERSLLPRGVATDEPGAVRVFPRDR